MSKQHSTLDLSDDKYDKVRDSFWALAQIGKKTYGLDRYFDSHPFQYMLAVDTNTTYIHRDREYTSDQFDTKFPNALSNQRLKFRRRIDLHAAICLVSPRDGTLIEDLSTDVSFWTNHTELTDVCLTHKLFGWDEASCLFNITLEEDDERYKQKFGIIHLVGQQVADEIRRERDDMIARFNKVA